MIDTDTIEKYILGGEWENQYPQVIEELLAEIKRLRKALLLIADTANGRPFVSGHIGLPFVHKVFKELIDDVDISN